MIEKIFTSTLSTRIDEKTLEAIQSELDMLNNKGAVALPAYFMELGVKAKPCSPWHCVVSMHIENMFGVRVCTTRGGDQENSVAKPSVFESSSSDVIISLGHGELEKFAGEFDSENIPELIDRGKGW